MTKNDLQNKPDNFDERRRDKRFEFFAPYRFYLDGEEYGGTLRNISKNGAFLSGQACSIPDSCQNSTGELHIEIQGQEFSCKAQVVFLYHVADAVFPVGAGVMFTDVGDASMGLLNRLISDYQLSDQG